MNVTVIFEKDCQDNLQCGWGVSYLVGDSLLFDTGEKYEYLDVNFEKIGIDQAKIKQVVISHNHWDHRQGLWELLKKKPTLQIWGCEDFTVEFKPELNKHTVHVTGGVEEIIPGVFTAGCMKTQYKEKVLLEQSLVLESNKGLALICGCAHPGLTNIIESVIEYFDRPVYAVLGGFHLIDKDARFIHYVAGELKKLGVKKIFPGHCTGYEAIQILSQHYQENCVMIKAGMRLEI